MPHNRILVVEDEAIVAHDIEQMLQELGYNVVGVVDTGAAAVELAHSARPDLVLMDIRLKGTPDGIESAKRIRESADVPIVFLTAYGDDVTLERAKAAAPYGYLIKPLVERELHSTVQVALHRRQVEPDAAAHRHIPRMLQDLGGGYYVLDREWRFTDVSSTAERILGVDRERLLGRVIWEEFPELQESVVEEVLHAARESGEEAATEVMHLPAHRRMRLLVSPSDHALTVYFFALDGG